MMVQLIIDGNYMPEIDKNRYICAPKLLTEQLQMISGRIVQKVRGTVQTISAQYNYIDTTLLRGVMAVLRSGKPFPVTYLPDDSDTMKVGEFIVESMTNPTFSFSAGGVPYWAGLAFTLREVSPHD